MFTEEMNPQTDESHGVFDPKSFLESLFKNREAEIQVIFHNSTNHENITSTQNDDDASDFEYKPDLFFIIGAVSFIIFLVLFWATCKAFQVLKISLNDGIDDTVPVGDQNQQTGDQNVQSAASGHFLTAGMRQFHANLSNATATLRSRTSLKSEDDLPPPYDSEELSAQTTTTPSEAASAGEQQSPPPYHVAISMSEVELNHPVPDSEDETDSKVNLTAKKVMAKLTKVVRSNNHRSQ